MTKPAGQEQEYLREIVSLFEEQLRPVVASLLIQLNDRGVYIIKGEDFDELIGSFARAQSLEQQLNNAKIMGGSGGSGEPQVRIKGRG